MDRRESRLENYTVGEDDLKRGRERIIQRVTLLIRALVKNNMVKQNLYIMLVSLEYLCMLYYILRLVDQGSSQAAFKGIEDFLDVSLNENGIQISGVGGDSPDTMSTSYLESKGLVHAIVNISFTGIYLTFYLVLINRLYHYKSFD